MKSNNPGLNNFMNYLLLSARDCSKGEEFSFTNAGTLGTCIAGLEFPLCAIK